MLIRDSVSQERWAAGESSEQKLARAQRLLAEEIESNTVTVRDDAGFDTSNILAQMGRPMTCQEVIDKLKKCSNRLYFERSKSDPTKWGVYVLDPKGSVHVNDRGEVLCLIHVCGMEAGIMPEFSIIHKTVKRVPDPDAIGANTGRELKWKEIETFADETRGWRTVLLRLLRSGIVNQLDIETHFGWVPSRDSQKWHDAIT